MHLLARPLFPVFEGRLLRARGPGGSRRGPARQREYLPIEPGKLLSLRIRSRGRCPLPRLKSWLRTPPSSRPHDGRCIHRCCLAATNLSNLPFPPGLWLCCVAGGEDAFLSAPLSSPWNFENRLSGSLAVAWKKKQWVCRGTGLPASLYSHGSIKWLRLLGNRYSWSNRL